MIPANLILRPRNLKKEEAPIVELQAFTELTYCLFAAGMFFTFLGMWVPVFYVSLEIPVPFVGASGYDTLCQSLCFHDTFRQERSHHMGWFITYLWYTLYTSYILATGRVLQSDNHYRLVYVLEQEEADMNSSALSAGTSLAFPAKTHPPSYY
jgi:hypothetical protein